MEKINIAIDGPAGAGKSTIAKLVAKKLNYDYIDTGAMYRALTYLLINEKIDLNDEKEVVRTLTEKFEFRFDKERVILNKKDITIFLRSKEINQNVSSIVTNKEVRKYMVNKQSQLGKNKGVVMDGRDIASVVLKDAELKIFLTASIDSRAQRRFLENKEKGMEMPYQEVFENLEKRDYIDTYVSKALVKTDDAIEIDSTNMSIDQVVEKVISLKKGKVK